MGDIQHPVDDTQAPAPLADAPSPCLPLGKQAGGLGAKAGRWPTALFLAALAAAIIAALVYVSTTPPTIHADDSGETVTGCYRLDVPHPPGYPLFSLLGRLFCFLPQGSLAWRVNLLAVLLGAATVFIVVFLICRLVSRLARQGEVGGTAVALLAATGGLIFAFSRNFWLQSTGAKGGVYTLNTVLLAACFLLLLGASAAVEDSRRRDNCLCLLAFLLGVAMTNHLPSVLVFIPAFALGVLLLGKPRLPRTSADTQSQSGEGTVRGLLNTRVFLPDFVRKILLLDLLRLPRPKLIVLLALFFLLGLSVYLYLPLRAAQGPPINWYSPTTLERFMDVIMRRPYLEGEKLVDKDQAQLLRQAGRYLLTFKNEFNYLSSLFGFLGLAWLLRRGGRALWGPMLAAYLVLIAAAVIYPSPSAKLVWLLDNYFLPANMLFAVFIGLGLIGVVRWLAARLAFGQKGLALLLALLFLFPLFRNYRRNDGSYCYYSYDYGRNILATTDQGGIIFGEGDHNLMPLYYLLYSEGMRPDVSLVTTIFLHFEWGMNNLRRTYPQLDLEDYGGDINRRIVDIVTNNAADYPIYYSTSKGTLEEFDVPIKAQLVPNGLLLRFLGKGDAAVSMEELGQLARPWEGYRLRGLNQRLPCVDASTDLLFSYYASGYVNLGNSLQRGGRLAASRDYYGRALEALRGCLDCDDDLAPVYSNLAALAGRKGNYSEATQLVGKALELDPEYAGGYSNLGNICRLQGDFIKAEENYRRALGLDPDSDTARGNLDGLLGEDRGRLAWQYVFRGDESSRRGERERAVQDYETAAKLGLRHERLFSNLGVMYAQAGERDRAEENFRAALEVNPDFAEAHRNLAVLFLKEGDLKEARRVAEAGLVRVPDDAALRQVRDVIVEAQGRKGK